jgi:hypothetical protein
MVGHFVDIMKDRLEGMTGANVRTVEPSQRWLARPCGPYCCYASSRIPRSCYVWLCRSHSVNSSDGDNNVWSLDFFLFFWIAWCGLICLGPFLSRNNKQYIVRGVVYVDRGRVHSVVLLAFWFLAASPTGRWKSDVESGSVSS